jgi:SAM-dependent methyltransferase
MENSERQRRHYEGVAEKYYKCRQSNNHLVFKDLLWHSFFQNKDFLKESVSKVLEPMCGYAEGKEIIEKYVNANIEYEGFDCSDKCLDIAKRIDPDIKVYNMDAAKFKTNGKFDLIILIGGLHHISDLAKDFVNTLYGALNKGGYFINFEPTHNNGLYKSIRKFVYKKNPMFDCQSESGFALSCLDSIYSSCRFKIIDQIYPGLVSYILYFNPEAFGFLNIGNGNTVKRLFHIEKSFFRSPLGRKLSFATLTLLQK